MTTWNYIKGSEKDFEGAPDWCKQVIRKLGTGNIGYEENCNGSQSVGDRIWWPSVSSIDNCNTLNERDVNGTCNIEIIAQREPVATNDNRPWSNLRPRSIHHPDGTVQFGCIQTPLIDVDMVNHPSHYTQGSIECIDAIKAATVGKTGIEAVCVANVVKYLWRYEEKNGLEDVKKARWYLERLINELSESDK
jgi:hypothetical protein